MFSKHHYFYISLMLACSNLIYSMNFKDLPQEELQLFTAITNKENYKAEKILARYPLLNINRCTSNGTPYTLLACLNSNNDYMLNLLIDKGLIIDYRKTWTLLLGSTTLSFISTLFKHGALQYFNALDQIKILIFLLKRLEHQPREIQKKFINTLLTVELDIQEINKHLDTLFEALAKLIKDNDLKNYRLYAMQVEEGNRELLPISSCYQRDVDTYCSRQKREKNKSKAIELYSSVLTMLKSKGINFVLKKAPLKKLLTYLACEGNTELVNYLIHANTTLSYKDIEDVIHCAKNIPEDQEAVKFMDNIRQLASTTSDDEYILTSDSITFAQEQWIKHKNKSVVKLLRRITLIARLFKQFVPEDTAYTIAQYDTADFKDAKLALLPSYEQIQEIYNSKY